MAGDFNAEVKHGKSQRFPRYLWFKNLVHEKTCNKSIENPSCIYLLLTNCNKSFQKTSVISSGISDFYKIIMTVMITTFPKTKPRQIVFRDYKYFDGTIYKEDLSLCLDANSHAHINYREFQKLFLRVPDTHAPSKMKYVRDNEVPYVTKTLRKAIMTRSRLENKYQKI